MTGEGGHGGGPPIDRPLRADYLVSIIINGGATMPAFGREAPGAAPLNRDQVRDIVVYLTETIAKGH